LKKLFQSIVLSLTLCLFLSPTNSLAGQVALAWDPPDISTDVTGYMIHYGTAPGTYTQGVDVGNTLNYTVSNLTDGKTYYFAVTAYNAAAYESIYSNEVSITPSSQQYLLMIANPDPGLGTVSGPGISCGDTCLAVYNPGAEVSLVATATPGSTFDGWSGGGCSGTGTCTTTMNANITITANFKPSVNINITEPAQQYLLMISNPNPGLGSVSGSGINCGEVCLSSYNSGTVVSLSATAAPGSTFDGWSGGGCSGTGTCTTTMNANTTITANFKPSIVNYSITASIYNAGGHISPAGTSSVASGSSLKFSITPESGYRILSVKVDGIHIGAVKSYTFSDVAADHMIEASFRSKR
jgi:hypothetical protein